MKNKALLAALLAISTLILSGCLTLDIISTTTTTASTSTSTTTTLAPAEDENILSQANAASCDEEKLAVTSGGREYVVVNRILADGASQTLTYEDDGDFEVSEQAQSPAAGPASFPSIFIGNNNGHATTDSNLPILYPDTLRIRSTWTWSSANAPTADFVAQYELWFVADPAVGDIAAPDKTLSIRLTFPGAHSPSGSHIGIVALEGKTWNVWKDGSNISYVAHETSTSVDFDLKAFIGDAIFRGAIANSDNLHDIFAGFKIWSNGAGLASSGFSVVVQ
jgi:cellulose 1,4-beta-cellobiosidase